MKEELLLLQGAAQVAFDKQLADGARVHVGPEELITISRVGLGVVHRAVGALHQLLGGMTIRINADADARCDLELPSTNEMRQGETAARRCLRDVGRILWRLDLGQQDHELRHRLGGKRCRCSARTPPNAPQPTVAVGLRPHAQGVVDAFEVDPGPGTEAPLGCGGVRASLIAWASRSVSRHPIRKAGESSRAGPDGPSSPPWPATG